MSRHRLAVAILLASVVPAVAVEPLESVFQVTYRYAGADEVFTENRVPLLPGNACYNWYVRMDPASVPASVVEILILPMPLADWGSVATDTTDGIDISADGTTAIKTFAPAADADGWFSDGWCVAEGDPVGAHRIEVSAEGVPLATYEFEVVLPEDYSWPSIAQPDRTARGVDKSW